MNEECHKQSYVKNKDIKQVSSLKDVERELLIWRSGIEMDENTTICLHHEFIILKRYPAIQTTCCDPFNSHNMKRRKGKYIYIVKESIKHNVVFFYM